MGQIKNNAYTLYIYNGGVDSPNSDAKIGIRYNKLTKIDNNGTKLNLSLFGLSFHRKIYEPGLINAEIQITVVSDDNGNIKIPDINILENYFIRKKVELKVSVPDKATATATTYTLAENYYIHEIHPLYERNVNNTYIYLKLTIRSMDNLMCLNKFSEAYLGRQFRNNIVREGIKDYGSIILSNSDNLQHLSAIVDNSEVEFTQPYLVQYNESFYDFVIRTANRCGEFVYFEDGELHVGINPNKTPINVDNYSRITYCNISEGPLDIDDYAHDSINKNKYDSENKDDSDEYTYKDDAQFKVITVKWEHTIGGKDVYQKREYKWADSSEAEFKGVKDESLVKNGDKKLSGDAYKIYTVDDFDKQIIIYKDGNEYKKSYLENWDNTQKEDFGSAKTSGTKLVDDKLYVHNEYVYLKSGDNYTRNCLNKDKIEWKTASEYEFYYARKNEDNSDEYTYKDDAQLEVITVKREQVVGADVVYKKQVYKWADSSKTEFKDVKDDSLIKNGDNKLSGDVYKIYKTGDSNRQIIIYKDGNEYKKSYLENWDETQKEDFDSAKTSGTKLFEDKLYVYNEYVYFKDNDNYIRNCLKQDKIGWETIAVYEFNYVRTKSIEDNGKPDGEKNGSYNVSPVEKTEIFPHGKVYNAEVTSDEFYMPLYRNQFSDQAPFSDNIYWEYIWSKKSDYVSHFLKSLSDKNLIDAVSDYALYHGQRIGQAALDWDSKNKKGNSIIDVWEKDAKVAVPFASSKQATWTTLEYYHDIKKYEERQQLQTVCVDMDSEIIVKDSPLKIGDIVTLTGNTCKYIVIEIEMRGDVPWQRIYSVYGSSDIASNEATSKSRLCFYAVPIATIIKDGKEIEMFYPPVLPSGAFRKSDPQHAIVVDSNDPKRLGRVRIRYPWQSHHTEGSGKDDILKDAATPWIRMVTPMATGGGGMYFKPEVGDEVLVNFENGNIERPYVVGTLYSKNNLAPSATRIIQSPNGHYIEMSDPTDSSKLLSSTLPLLDVIKKWKGFSSVDIEATNKMLGGITISDAYGLYSIKMSSDKRRVEIESAFGDVKISAFSGITISAPHGNVKIEGKNVEICANNKLTLTSGKNISSAAKDTKYGTSGKELAETVLNRAGDITGGLIDLSIIRTFMECILKPVNGTTQIHSNSFLLLEAGNSRAEIPVTAYKERYLANKNLQIGYNGNGYQALQYILNAIYTNIKGRDETISRLYNDACAKLSELHYTVGTDDKNIFKDGHGLITNLTADDFVNKCCDKWTTITLKASLEWKKREEGNAITKKFSDKQKDVFISKVVEAYMSVNALSEYCKETSTMFKHQDKKDGMKYFDGIYNRFDASSIFKLLDEKFLKILDDEYDEHVVNWIFPCDIILHKGKFKYTDFVNNSTAKSMVATVSETSIIRKMCFLVLGNSENADDNSINGIDYMKNRKLNVSFSSEVEVSCKSDYPGAQPDGNNKYKVKISIATLTVNEIATDDVKWNAYVKALTLVDTSEESGFLGSLGKGIMKNLDEKILTLSPERDVWSSDGKGRILMSDSAETLSFNNTSGSGVTIKADSNPKLDKKHKDEAESYLKKLLTQIGG